MKVNNNLEEIMKYIIAILIPMFLTACPFFPLVAATGVGTAGYIATQDR